MRSEEPYSGDSDPPESNTQLRSAISKSHHSTKPEGDNSSVIPATAPQKRNKKDSHRERATRINRMEFLPEVDDELDYNEDDLPSLTRRDETATASARTHFHSRSSNKNRSALTSPREEGEEYTDDEEESYSQSDPRRAPRLDKGRLRAEREEGEASSEDERRYPRTSRHPRSAQSTAADAITTDAGLFLDEAHYRNRLQERYERREARRSKTSNADSELDQRDRSATNPSQFVVPRSKLDTSPYTTVAQLNPTGPASLDLDRRVRTGRSQSSDKGSSRPHMPEEVPGQVDDYSNSHRSIHRHGNKSDRRAPDQESRSKSKRNDHDSSPSTTKSNQPPRSCSTSYLEYADLTGQTEEQIDSEQRLRTELRHAERNSRKAKSKKSKRDRDHDRDDYRTHKKSNKIPKPQSYTELEYGNWEPRKYEKLPSTDLIKGPGIGIESGEQRRYSSGASSRSRSASSSTYASHSPSPSPRSSATRKNRSRYGTSHSKTDPDHLQGKHKRKYHRDAREAAPPPDALRTQNSIDSTSRNTPSASRGHKTEKQKMEELDQIDSQIPSKRNRHSIEVIDDGSVTNKLYQDESRRSTSRTRRIQSDSQDRKQIGSTASNPASDKPVDSGNIKAVPRHTHAAIAGYPHTLSSSGSSDSESGEPSDSNHPSGHDPTDENSDSMNKGSMKQDRDLPSSRRAALFPPRPANPYRLYSESESDEDDENGDMQDDDDGPLEGKHARRSADVDELNGVHEDEVMASGTDRRESPIPSKPFYFPSIQGCRSVEEFECLNRIEEGTYGVVYRARDKKSNEIVALKRLKMEKERDGFPITSLREINTLMKAQHENIVTVREIVVGSNMDKIYLVMDYVEHDLKSLMEIMNGPFSVGEVKCLLLQLLRAVRHLHDNWILHRDLKTSNLLLSHKGILKVGDFGLAREYGSPLKHYTEVVVTLWYRAPELLLGTKQYTCPIDMWSVGCIFAEFLLQRPLFPGKGEVDELNIIFRDLGTPTERIWPGVSQLPGMKKCVFTNYPYNQLRRRFTEKQISDQGFDLLNSFLTYCPEKRITAEKALSHAYFNERPRAIHPSMFPSWPAKSEGAVSVRRASPRPPAGGGALAAAAAAVAAAAAAAASGSGGGSGRVRYQPPAPPMGGQRFYSSMGIGGGPGSRSGTAIGSGDLLSSGPDKGFLLRF